MAEANNGGFDALIDADRPSMIPEGMEEEIPILAGAEGDITDADILTILKLFATSRARGYGVKQSYNYVALQTGRSPSTISKLIRDLAPRTKVAEMKLKAAAGRMVEKIIEKAPTHELIDVLSRPNMGVLQPIKQQTGGGGFFINVTGESLGAVNIGVVNGIPTQAVGQSHVPAGRIEGHTADPQPALAQESVGGWHGQAGGGDSSQEEPEASPEAHVSGGSQRGRREAGAGRARVGGVQGRDVGAQGPQVKRRHQKDGVLDRTIHLDHGTDSFPEE